MHVHVCAYVYHLCACLYMYTIRYAPLFSLRKGFLGLLGMKQRDDTRKSGTVFTYKLVGGTKGN